CAVAFSSMPRAAVRKVWLLAPVRSGDPQRQGQHHPGSAAHGADTHAAQRNTFPPLGVRQGADHESGNAEGQSAHDSASPWTWAVSLKGMTTNVQSNERAMRMRAPVRGIGQITARGSSGGKAQVSTAARGPTRTRPQRRTKRLFAFWIAQAASTAGLVLGLVKLLG